MRLIVALACALAVAVPVVAEEKPDSGALHVLAHLGARVYVDGRLAGISLGEKLGLTLQNLTAGTHTIRVTRSGYRPKELRVVVRKGTRVEVNMDDLKVLRRIKVRPREEPVDMTASAPPMTVDDTGTPGAGNWELNSAFEADRARGLELKEVPSIDANYGVGETLQLTYEVPFVVLHDRAEDGSNQTARSIGNTTIGVKYRFYDDEDSGLSLAVYPQVDFHTPGEARSVEEPTSWLLPVLLTRDFTNASISANGIAEKSAGDSHINLSAIFGAGTRISPQFALVGEISARDLSSSDDRQVSFRMGVRTKIDESQVLFAAVGIDLRSGADGLRHRYLNIGYQRFVGQKDH